MAQVKQKSNGGRKTKSTQNRQNSRSRERISHDNVTEEQNNTQINRELVIWITLIASILLLLCVFGLCGPLNNVFGALLFGMFGLMAYIFPFLLFFSVGLFFMNRNNKKVKRKVICSWLLYFIVSALFQMLVNDKVSNVFDCYVLGYKTKFGGGFIGGCISLGLTSIMGTLATAIILIIVCIMLFVFITGKMLASMVVDKSVDRYNEYAEDRKKIREVQRKEDDERRVQEREERFNDRINEKKNRRRMGFLFPENDVKASDEYEFIEEVIDNKQDVTAEPVTAPISESMIEPVTPLVSEVVNEVINPKYVDETKKAEISVDDLPIYEKELISKFGRGSGETDNAIEKLLTENFEEKKIVSEPELSDSFEGINITNMYNDFEEDIVVEEEIEQSFDEQLFNEQPQTETEAAFDEEIMTDANPDIKEDIKAVTEVEAVTKVETVTEVETVKDIETITEGETETVDIDMPPEPIPYIFPSLDLLSKPPKNSVKMSDAKLKETALKLQECLKSFKVDVTMREIICGPTVTRYELQPALGTRVKKITELENDIKLYLAAKDLRIEAPIPGKSAVGIEVPNSENVTITIREMLETKEFQEHKSNISFAVGKDIGGHNIVTDIQKMPHLLIAGSTGSGKSVCINTIVMSLIYKADPNDVKLIMIDPKVVELSIYNGLPHLCIPVVSDPKKAAAALHWAEVEMDDRYNKFAELGVRDLIGFNKKLETLKENPHLYRKMPQIVIIVDELADLMMVASHDVESAICRLAQKARACGIHLIIATQRPSVDVITGLIKANIPSRIAFAVSSQVDSRTILDSAGAEKLLGKGDMLFFPQGLPKPVRVQGAFVSDNEVQRVTDFVKAQYEQPVYDQSIDKKINEVQFANNQTASQAASMAETDDNGRDEIFAEAGRFIIEKQKASIGTLQRVFKIGFNRGARVMDQLCEAGVVSEEDGKKPRNILMTMEEFEQILEEGR